MTATACEFNASTMAESAGDGDEIVAAAIAEYSDADADAGDTDDTDDVTEDPSGTYVPLTGNALLAKIKALGDTVSKKELIQACGHVKFKPDGTKRVCYKSFYEATLKAKGVDIDSQGESGRKLRATTKVRFDGVLVVSRAHTESLGLKPGDQFTITTNPKKKEITFTPLAHLEDQAS